MLTLAALLSATGAWADGAVSARPTLLLGADRVERGSYDTELNLGLSATTPELLPGLTAQAEVSLLAAATDGGLGFTLADNSSYLRLAWQPASWAPGEGLALTVLPLHADRLYLGYDFPLAYGLMAPGPLGATNGLDLRLHRGLGYGFAALKTRMVFNEQDHEAHRYWSLLAGGGVDVLPVLRLEVEAARADLGVNPQPQVLGKPLDAPGLAARLLAHTGAPIGPPTDFARYRRDPAVWEELLRPELYDDGLSTLAAAEVLYLVQHGLGSPETAGQTESVPALGWAAEGRLRWRQARAFVRAWARSLSLIQAEVPGFPPFFAFPSNMVVEPEYAASVAGDYQLPLRLTPGVAFELRRPASFTTQDVLGGNSPPGLAGTRAVVVYDANVFGIEPKGGEVGVLWTARATLRWDTAPFSLIAEGFLTHDPNRTTFKDDSLGISEPSYDDPNTLGFFLLAQAGF